MNILLALLLSYTCCVIIMVKQTMKTFHQDQLTLTIWIKCVCVHVCVPVRLQGSCVLCPVLVPFFNLVVNNIHAQHVLMPHIVPILCVHTLHICTYVHTHVVMDYLCLMSLFC